jgi:tRNA threonylcarbamoyladenosine biosynthesis protein TsaB
MPDLTRAALSGRPAGLRLLSLCTSGVKGSVFAASLSSSWAINTSQTAIVYQEAGRESASIIFRMIDQALAEAGLDDFDLICFDKGPGAFTGVRIGCGVAQGLGFGKTCPVLGVNSLATLGLEVKKRGASGQDSLVFVAVDARMGEVYCAAYRSAKNAQQNQETLLAPLVCSAKQAARHFETLLAQHPQINVDCGGNAFAADSSHAELVAWAGTSSNVGASPLVISLNAELVALAALSMIKKQCVTMDAKEALSMLRESFPAALAAPDYVRNSVALDKEQQAQLRLSRSLSVQ